MELVIIIGLMVSAIVFSVILTQEDRGHWCKKQWEKVKWVK